MCFLNNIIVQIKFLLNVYCQQVIALFLLAFYSEFFFVLENVTLAWMGKYILKQGYSMADLLDQTLKPGIENEQQYIDLGFCFCHLRVMIKFFFFFLKLLSEAKS